MQMPPVEDHPVHASVKIDTGHRYTVCQNKPPSPADFVFSKDCRYDESDKDPGCIGCKQPKDIEYITKIKASK